ncbi:hypothetical protein VNO78_10398 [Psophocarpus tetragonolobus]|uniref:Uncharacterized protein n=1 Tax=Psophocarpus tetragonolobus TaxID=3891 RepID=A0AAN9XMQ2_PSOTE
MEMQEEAVVLGAPPPPRYSHIPIAKPARCCRFWVQGNYGGDGIIDHRHLWAVAADVGMAIGAAIDIAIEAADIVLMKSNLNDVIIAIDLSRYCCLLFSTVEVLSETQEAGKS